MISIDIERVKMNFVFITHREMEALIGLPYIQQSAYLLGIRPYMDRKTQIVGIKRRISYQSLCETLYIEPHSGIKSGSPSREQVRRVIKALERAGLIHIQSNQKHLILKCLLADPNFSVQNKPDTKPTHEHIHSNLSNDLAIPHQNDNALLYTDSSEVLQADIPHNSEHNMYFYRKFEIFWSLYPQKSSKHKALEAFQKINPDTKLFESIIDALQQQIEMTQLLDQQGKWTPPWKYPANWLQQECWKDEISKPTNKENKYAKNQGSHKPSQSSDPFWDSCKDGAYYGHEIEYNVINLQQFRETKPTD